MDHTIFLIGFMGCGKTTLGRALEARCGVRFVDLDDYIEARAGMTVTEIFATRGEAAFRAMEREALMSLSDAGAVTVVACGGGTPCFGDNMEMMNSRGATVWLTSDTQRLFERLSVARASRPLIARLDDGELRGFIDAKLCERTPHYAKAAHRFDTTHLDTVDELARATELFAERFLVGTSPHDIILSPPDQ